MPRFVALSVATFGALVLIGCSSGARSTEPTPTAAIDLTAAQHARPEPGVPPTSALEVHAMTPATPAPGAEPASRPAVANDPASAPTSAPTSQAASLPVRTLPRDRDVPVGYVALGDSTVEGIGATSPDKNYVGRIFSRLKEKYPAASVQNLGVAGATSADVARAQLPKAVALRPRLVTLSVGPNDVTQGRSIEEYERHVDTILGTLARETDAVVVVNTLPDLAVSPIFKSEEKPIVGTLARAFNDVLVQKARQYGAEVVELYAPSQEEVPANTSLFSADNYHPSDAGYARWADFMWRGIEVRLEDRG